MPDTQVVDETGSLTASAAMPGETSCLTLVWAVLDLYITHATNGIKFTQLEASTERSVPQVLS